MTKLLKKSKGYVDLTVTFDLEDGADDKPGPPVRYYIGEASAVE